MDRVTGFDDRETVEINILLRMAIVSISSRSISEPREDMFPIKWFRNWSLVPFNARANNFRSARDKISLIASLSTVNKSSNTNMR